MLTLLEKILFGIAVVVSLYMASQTFGKMFKIILRGKGELGLNDLAGRIFAGLFALFTLQPVFKTRKTASIFHGFIAWGFLFYFLVNAFDVFAGYSTGFANLLATDIFGPYRLLADVLSVGVLAGMIFFLVRRFIQKDQALTFRDNIKVNPKVAAGGTNRDSLIVGLFILLHVGFRFLGESFLVAHEGHFDAWQPFASTISLLWGGLGANVQMAAWHVSFWMALGLILLFLPYFPYTKHIHLMMGPFNFMTRPHRRSMGELEPLDFEDEEIEQFGAATLTDLSQTQLVDAFACIMCNRCQDLCPAYLTGKELSPSALEVNKRYAIKDVFDTLSEPETEDTLDLMDFALSESAVWACTTCGACVEICPMGNEPFLDIMDIRRNQVLMESEFPSELQNAFRGMERNSNPWQMADDRTAWTESLAFEVPTVEENPDFDILFWVGCAGAFDPSAQQTARAFASILNKAGVNYAILGNEETCTGDTARRAGNEYLFFEMANGVVETLNENKVKKIVATCPHCLHTIANEYPQFGGEYEVVHHTEFINQLIGAGKIKLREDETTQATFHDPCYLGRHNGVYDDPRQVLTDVGFSLTEMTHNNNQSFCCGAGGAQMWKEEEHGEQAVNLYRFNEAQETGADTLAVGCPFCAQMMNDANRETGETMQVKDVAQLVADSLL